MSIIYVVIAKDTSVLCDYSEYRGNFDQMSAGLLKQVQRNMRAVFTYQDQYFFHYADEEGLTYMCMREASFPSDTAFAFLESLKNEFLQVYKSSNNDPIVNSLQELFQNKIKEKVEYYNANKSNPNDDVIERLKSGLVDTKNSVIDTADILSQRGEKINLIVKKADSLAENSDSYYKGARNVKRAAQCKKIKYTLGLIGVCLIVAWLVASLICGFNFKGCT